MNASIIKPILGGLIIGAALFFLPFFVLKVLVFLLIIGLLVKLFRRGRYRGPAGWAYADKIRSMSDDDYRNFKSKWGHGCPGKQIDETENQES